MDSNDLGRSPAGSGYSAEPEPISVVSAVPVSIPNAEFDHGMMAGLEIAACILHECLSDDYCDNCKSPWKYDHERDEEANAFDRLCDAASAIEARRAATEDTGAVHESAVPAGQTPKPSRGTDHG